MKTKYYEFLKTIANNSYNNNADINLLSDSFDDFKDILDEEYNADDSTNENDDVIEHFNKFNSDIDMMLNSIEDNYLSIDEFNKNLNNILDSELKHFSK